MAVVIFLCCLLGGIAMGLPIAWSLLLCGAALMTYLDMFDVQIMAQTLVNGADSFSLLAIPFFVLAGEIMNAGGLSKRIVDLPMKLVGHKPGGLGYVGVIAAMIMASLSGSAVADTAAVAALLVPMMRSANYPINRSVGLIASGGIIAPIIPPSIPFIIFGVSSGLSISKLFMAGIAPGIMMGAALMLTWWWQAGRLNLPSQPKATPREIWQSLVSGIWALFLPVIIIGGFRSGLFTPTEAGAVASLPQAGSDLFFLPFLYGSNAGLEMTCGFYGMQALHTRAHLLQAIYEGVVFSHMTHLNRMRERFTDVCALRVTGGPAHSDVWMQMLADVSGLRIELPQVEETGCFGAALAARIGTGVYRDFREAQRDLRHPVRTLLPDMAAHTLYQRKYRQYQDLITALQGYHARIKEHAL